MGHYEDLFYEIHQTLTKYGLQEEYNSQIEKMQHQDKHEYKDARERMRYACDKVVSKYHKKNEQTRKKTRTN